MLPKIASHILHQTSRAAATVQSAYFRNVLQFQSASGPSSSSSTGLGGWSGAGSSSSSWGSQGAGPGGAKYHAGSHFQQGFNGVGRSLTQANASTSADGLSGQNDDTDEVASTPFSAYPTRKYRLRSNSLSANVQNRRESSAVLKMVQMHARAYHVFSLDTKSAIESTDPAPPSLTASSKHGLLVRRNSISATTPTSDSVENDLPLPLYQTLDHPSITDPVTPQSTTPPPELGDESHSSPAYRALSAAAEKGDPSGVVLAVNHFLSTAIKPKIQEYNMALEALHKTRVPGQPLNLMLETYNDMITRSIYPSIKTYSILILALTQRDLEIHKAIAGFESRDRRVSIFKTPIILQGPANQKQIDDMRLEANFSSAYSLFTAASSIAAPSYNQLPYAFYSHLLRCAAHHGNVNAALFVFAQMERCTNLMPSVSMYTSLLSVYVNAGDTAGAREVFDEFIESARNNSVLFDVKSSLSVHRLMWNKMIGSYLRDGQPDKALSLLEDMMDTKSDAEFDPLHPPAPDSSTYTRIINGFCEIGDMKTALSWFERLLQQPQDSSELSFLRAVPPPPDHLAWTIMLESLARHNMVDDLNRLFSVHLNTAARDGHAIRAVDRITVFEANMQALGASDIKDEYAIGILDFLSTHVLAQDLNSAAVSTVINESSMHGALTSIVKKYLKHKDPSGACSTLERCFQIEIELARNEAHRLYYLKRVAQEAFPDILSAQCQSQAPFQEVLRVFRLSDSISWLPGRPSAPYFLHSFASHALNSNKLDLTLRDWELLIHAAIAMEDVVPRTTPQAPLPDLPGFAFTGIPFLLESMANHQVPLENLNQGLLRRLTEVLVSRTNRKGLDAFLSKLDPNYEKVFKTYISIVRGPEPPRGVARVARKNTRNDAARYHIPENPLQAYDKFERELVESGRHPSPTTIGWLINSLGRIGEFEKVKSLYDVGQNVLAALESDKRLQFQAWFQIEDSMIMAYAHGGNVEAAHVHRERILDQGGAPSADAYGALIQSVKDTTDDCSSALALFEESQAQGVAPSIYLYNTIISKLAKARKADHAIELFHQMKSYQLNPSSITFGALISACTRVGDTLSAELLFEEMAQQPNFKPRIPPYNTMIQMYTTTKPSRERALFYFQRLVTAGLAPTSHTYKLLLDTYGTIEPIDIAEMEGVFRELENNPSLQIQGTHWASLINAYGCVQKDLDKAIAIFDNIDKHPSSARSTVPLPDAVTYEALLNVLVTHRRSDLIPIYIEQLQSSNIHMTAYIANLIIKGYAAANELDKAREFFESLEDPPEGIAAPNNRAPHHEGGSPSLSSASSPVYREPSTWEAMVRAELGSGNRTHAQALIKRLQARKFPPAVEQRISGIMLNDSVSPWSPSNSSEDTQSP